MCLTLNEGSASIVCCFIFHQVIKTCRKMGIQSVAVHSDVDSSAVSCRVFIQCSLYFPGNSCQHPVALTGTISLGVCVLTTKKIPSSIFIIQIPESLMNQMCVCLCVKCVSLFRLLRCHLGLTSLCVCVCVGSCKDG